MAPENFSQSENLETAVPTVDIAADLKLKQGQVEQLAKDSVAAHPDLAATTETKKANCLNRLSTLGSQTMEKVGSAAHQTYEKVTTLFQ